MEFLKLIFIFKISFVFFATIIFLSIPFLLILEYKDRKYLNILPLIGLSVLMYLNSLMYELKLLSKYKTFILIFFIFYFFIIILIFLKRKKYFYPIYRNTFFLYSKIIVGYFIVSFIFIYIFLYFQHSYLPFIPSYEVNHDPISIMSLSKYLMNFPTPFGNVGGVLNSVSMIKGGYPYSYSLILVLIYKIFKIDIFNFSHIINVFIYSLSFFPISSLIGKFLRIKTKRIIYPVSFFTLFSYLGIQITNQSFYSQTMLLPFLISSIIILDDICTKDKKNISMFLFIFLLLGIVLSYSLTGFYWLVVYILLTNFFLLYKKTYLLMLNYNRRIVFSLFALFLLIPIQTFRTLKFFTGGFFSVKREGSFFTALGNTLGYPSFFVSLNTWPVLDFRINQTTNKFMIFTIFYTLILIFISLFTFLKQNKLEKIHIIKLIILTASFVLPILIMRFLFKSPYYYSKTLYYGSFIFTGILLSGIFFGLTIYKNILFKLILTFFIFFYLNNSLRSVGYYGLPPLEKFEEIKDFKIFFNENKISKIVVIDDEDWLKYFLYEYGSCISFVRSFPCNIGYVVVNGKIYLTEKNGFYLIGKDFLGKISNINSFQEIKAGKNYNLYRTSRK